MGSIVPHAVREVANEDLEWLIHRQIYQKRIDVLQLEYTPMAQYRGEYRRIAAALFEHDIYFQSIGRGLGRSPGILDGLKARFEYLRALRYELRTLPRLRPGAGLHAGQPGLPALVPAAAWRPNCGPVCGRASTPSRYEFRPGGREPFTMLFLGSFRHAPNRAALDWFIRHVMPRIVERAPRARLVVAGSDPPPPTPMPITRRTWRCWATWRMRASRWRGAPCSSARY